MRMGYIATPLTAILLAMPLIAGAASTDDGKKPDFSKADANGDGKITVSEATASGVPKAEAEREDIDSDGKLTRADWKFVDMKADSQSGSDSS